MGCKTVESGRNEISSFISAMTRLTDSEIAIAWCLAWGNERSPNHEPKMLERFLNDLRKGKSVASDLQPFLTQLQRLQTLKTSVHSSNFPDTLVALQNAYPELWAESTPIGLVYGGATKIKQYVFEGNNLQDIRGASALLDRINLLDLPGFFKADTDARFPECQKAKAVCQKAHKWLQEKLPDLTAALIPELIIYSTGGNILAFCPAAYVDDLANAIECRYTEETLSANSCTVGDRFRLLELHFGLLPEANQKQFWLNDYITNPEDPILQAYFGQSQTEQTSSDESVNRGQEFIDRKTFSELVTKLASQFNQRRAGMDGSDRPSRRFPPMFETHPYLQRDEGGRRAATTRIESLPSQPKVSLPSARKRVVGQFSKREDTSGAWFTAVDSDWHLDQAEFPSWISRFEAFLNESEDQTLKQQYYAPAPKNNISEARSLPEIGATCTPKGFVAHIYADGNNMGGYIQKHIKSPDKYQTFSQEIFTATQEAVYRAIATCLQVRQTERTVIQNKVEKQTKEWIHPFEILAIGGDDVSLIVPADKALAVAQAIGEAFEEILQQNPKYRALQSYKPKTIHRYYAPKPPENLGQNQSILSMSMGVLLCADNTPIYYAQSLVEQLLKSAKKRAKDLKAQDYFGGTIDFLVMKSVTMISSNIKEFRNQALTKPKLKLYAAPYTLHEISGLLATVQALKDSGFPRSQLYQMRSFLEQGRRTAMLNYRYFCTRLGDKGGILKTAFEEAWCPAKTNGGNLAPWMSILAAGQNEENPNTTYETIWRDLVDLIPFTKEKTQATTQTKSTSVIYNPLSSSEPRSLRR